MMLYVLMVGLLPGVLAQLSCPDGQSCAAPLCPNTIVQYMCNISVPRVFTRWTVPVQSCGGTDTTLLLLRQSAQSNCGSQSILCGQFRASNVPPVGDTSCTSSILYVNVTQELQGSSITCNSSDVNAQFFVGSAKIHVLVLPTPSAPHLSVSAELNGLEVSCSSGDQDTYCNVTIQMNGAVQSVAANTTFNGLTSNMMYPISARAINRCGDYSETSASHWTLPEAPPTSTISVFQSLINESATQLNISWSHIGGNVSQYLVKSISGMNIFTSQVSVQSFCGALSCAYHQIVKTIGSGYTITISSVNDGGVGPESDPVQGQSKSSSSASYSEVAVGIGIGITLLIIVICIAAAFMFVVHVKKIRAGHSYSPQARPEPNDSSEMNVSENIKTQENVSSQPTLKTSSQKNVSALELKGKTIEQPVSQISENAAQQGNSTQCIASEDRASVQNPSDETTLPQLVDHKHTPQLVISDQERLTPLQQSTIHSASKECKTSQSGLLCHERKSLDRIPHYIKAPHNGTVLTIQDRQLVFTTTNYIPDNTQLWYVDDQPDNSFMIVSKKKKMVLACIESGIVIQDRRGDDRQKWLQQNNTIVSSKYQTVICVKDNVPVCVETSGHGNHLCCLQSSLKVPMCLVDEENDSVLEISDDKVIFNPNVDFTNLNQHWYIYPDSQRDKTFTIVSRKEQKVLQLHDNNELIIKQCDSEGVAIWTIDHGYFHTESKRFKVYPMFRNCFMIRFQSHYLTWDILEGNVVLCDSINKSMPSGRHLWILDIQQDGIFTMASSIANKKLLANKYNTIKCCHASSDDYQLWRREGNFIKSVNPSGYLGIPKSLVSCMSNCGPNHECTTPKGHSSLVIMDCKQDIDNWQLECESTKVVLQVTKIVHKNTGSVLSTDNGNSKLSICLRNCLPHSIQDQFWVLDYRLDGTFLIISDTKEKLVLSCHSSTSTPEESQLVMSQFNGDENELWSFDGGHVESVKFKDRVISLMPGSQTSLCLTTKSTTDSAQLFQPESYTPVLIRCLMDDTVLELDDASVLKFSAVDETWPDSQVWYIKYRNGFSNPSFMIISKKNGQALQVVESNVESKEIEPTNENQQWKRDGLFIVSLKGYHKQMTYDFKSANVMATGEDHKLVLRSQSLQKSNCYFEFKHFAVESYF